MLGSFRVLPQEVFALCSVRHTGTLHQALRSAYCRRHHQTAQKAAAAGAKKKQLTPTSKWLLQILHECDLKPISWASVRCMLWLTAYSAFCRVCIYPRSFVEVCAETLLLRLHAEQGFTTFYPHSRTIAAKARGSTRCSMLINLG